MAALPESDILALRWLSKRTFLLLARIAVVVGSATILGMTFMSKDENMKETKSLIRESRIVDEKGNSLQPSLRTKKKHSNNEGGDQGPLPRIVWLMSFPNSGTSYTGQLVKHLTLTRTASNYGERNLGRDGQSVPVYSGHWDGPFYVDPASSSRYTNPTKYVMVKTHCGGYTQNSSPDKYVESALSFQKHCLSTKYIRHKNKGNVSIDSSSTNRGAYDGSLVYKAIHLFRNPFDNIVSRFNFEHKRLPSNLKEEMPKSREGFREFCRRMDTTWKESEKNSIVFDEELLSLMERVPCHSDFFRYIEWHNMAFVSTEDLNIDTMILHYEDYDTNFNETKDSILEFLELTPSPRGTVRPFFKGKVYSEEYFTSQERAVAKTILQRLALHVTWSSLEYYFS